ncbi:MAG: Lrp/AsnC family transcriptional regulator [Candidatus Eremiobacteraeota bacterium]|nr:Lrp/AsnC family transcriptional regulator [Candidatus Eremiobacteraeota bacterium]MBC5803731.1 Lrp/AsnC family transcriptional regulator [Candidatus Eremiobacteraeota bacterium]MBC5822432.1 Lrp/AsnC family transcriptional regulator [Candidatus Eremiobacteraeota bacterium]
MTVLATPVTVDDPVNAEILKVSEDRIAGFLRDPFGAIAQRSGVEVAVVIERVRAMLDAGTIRRVRQTLLATNLAHGALVAWRIPPERLDDAFAYMSNDDPFSGHVVIRTADAATPGSAYRLWTTLKVPQGYSLDAHAAFLRDRVGAQAYRLMPAERLFALGVGHIRRRGLEPGSRADVLADVLDTRIVELSALEWQVLVALKREFGAAELMRDVWSARAREADVPLDEFYGVAESLAARGVIGRFSTFLEHVKPTAGSGRVTRYNALFHWQVPAGREIDAGREVGRHHIMTHAYWREGGPEFRNVNIMGVAHGLDKDVLLEHKAAIDAHLREAGIDIGYTNVFWGGRSEIKPSEISPLAFEEFHRARGGDPDTLRG